MADGFPGEKRLRLHAAALGGGKGPRRGCGASAFKGAAVDAKDNWGPGPQSGKHAPDISNLGHFKMLFD